MTRKTDPGAIRPYLEDASGMSGGAADEVVLPESATEVGELLAEAQKRGTPVTLSGGGTGLAGGRIPHGGLVLATDRLGGVLDVRPAGGGGTLVAGPAATLEEVEAAADAHGLFLPPDPTERMAWLGGAVSTNASGSRSFHYGPMRRWVRRLGMVLPDGTRLQVERGQRVAGTDGLLRLPGAGGERAVPIPRGLGRAVKSATGYASGPGLDLMDLIVGSEGTLAAVTEIEVELLARPQALLTGLIFFRSEADCLAAVRGARARSYEARGYQGPAPATPGGTAARPAMSRNLLARALELFGGDALDFMRQGGKPLPAGAGAALLFEQEHRDKDEEAVVEAWLQLLEEHGAMLDDSWIAQDDASRKSIREFRHALPAGVNEWLSRHGRRKYGTDIAVPDVRFDDMFATYRRDLAAAEVTSVSFGHVGDNHLHVNLLPRNDAEEERCARLIHDWVRHAIALDGVPSAEHGVGKLKASLLAEVTDPAVMASMQATKTALDPAGILGRGTLLASPPLP